MAGPPSLRILVNDALAQLRDASTAARRKVALWYFPSSMEAYGVAVPALRRVARSLGKELKGRPPSEVLRVANALIATNVMEARQVAYELLERRTDALEALSLKDLERLGKGMDNWSSVDAFSCSVAGRAWRMGRLRDSSVQRWARSRDRWWRRAALASTIPLNLASRGGAGDPPRTLAVCELLAADTDEMVGKALSWALRTLIEHDRRGVGEFLRRHEATLPGRVLREVQKKLVTGRKHG